MPFDEEGFSKDLFTHLTLVQNDLMILRTLKPEERKDVLKRVLNLIIDIPVLPEMIEALFCSFLVEAADTFVKNTLSEVKK